MSNILSFIVTVIAACRAENTQHVYGLISLSAYSALVAREDSESVGGHVRNDEGIEGKESPEVANRKSSFLAALARIRQGMCHRRK